MKKKNTMNEVYLLTSSSFQRTINLKVLILCFNIDDNNKNKENVKIYKVDHGLK